MRIYIDHIGIQIDRNIPNNTLLFQELFKRAENREQLKKRFEIQKKLRIQQKLKGSLTPKKRKSISEDDEPSLAAHEREKEKGTNRIFS